MNTQRSNEYQYRFRIQTNEKTGCFYVEERKGFGFSKWVIVHQPLSLTPIEFVEYCEAVHWIEHEVCRRVGLKIENAHYRN